MTPKQLSEPIELLTNPSTVVSLFHDGSATHKFKTVLHDLPCSEEYKKYLSTKYALGSVWEAIDWIALGWALRRLGNTGPLISKLIHGWLSTCSDNRRHGQH